MTCTSVFKLMPRKGEYIFKVFLFWCFYCIVIIFAMKRNKNYISGTLFVCRSSSVECPSGRIEILN